ncbi:ecto-NOX disulfide-thiol exchanger 2-like [Anneissia japonica]|uniref:ecto-NOX disulfide-thiol exchanger 2-like n=1 Tax=Anneissia japonica TaxID=1529436 RepID=UPI0014254C73|nr:ecto-NOX disulfide-thiol exchanger 2-like [Anneissia japonica]XP_033110322.1 ecto-NOX disulfide-thiol exchanger 2-like [Anneissia japonica]XP_033110323.1 ecto-NOX disulfide-thiol exchanger 2-like [Anneissia japonica]XP_033110324.1 ecto-NOX disulfide-thiol exchanger 2-like [Anneissia japonica]
MTAPFFLQQSLHLGGQTSIGNMPMLGQHGIDPASNDQPLQFSAKSGPKVIMGSSVEEGIKKDRRDMMSVRRRYSDNTVGIGGPIMPGMNTPGPGMNSPNMGGNGMGSMNPNWNLGSMWNEGGGMIPAFDQMPANGALGRGGMPGGGGLPGNMVGGNDMLPLPQMMQQKEVIHLTGATLFPPPVGAPPSVREKPYGCRTIFVGGLPENVTEDLVREMFACCGEIVSYRKGKKNFCHVRFSEEVAVDKALYISGYRLCINNSKEPDNIGRIHVDYAQARDDQYDFECRQRQFAREMRHRVRMEEQLLRPPSPPVMAIPYSDHESTALAENLKSDENFLAAVSLLISWLDKGDCTKRTASTFYSMIQSVNSQVRRLMNEKQTYVDEWEVAKNVYRHRVNGLFNQFSLIESVFVSATKQRAWDHFTKPQRKNIDTWKKQAKKIKLSQQEELSNILNEKGEADMDVSDDEDAETKTLLMVQSAQEYAAKNQLLQESSEAKKIKLDSDEEVNTLKEENDTMRCQLEAFKNEMELLKVERAKEYEEKDTQIKALQHALLGMQQQLMEAKGNLKKHDEEKKKQETEKPSELTNWLKTSTSSRDVDSENKEKTSSSKEGSETTPETVLTETDGMLVGLLATFLHVHPFGASIEYLWSYLQRLDPKVTPREIESILVKLPTVFKQELFGVGATLEKRWQFIGFKTCLKEKE